MSSHVECARSAQAVAESRESPEADGSRRMWFLAGLAWKRRILGELAGMSNRLHTAVSQAHLRRQRDSQSSRHSRESPSHPMHGTPRIDGSDWVDSRGTTRLGPAFVSSHDRGDWSMQGISDGSLWPLGSSFDSVAADTPSETATQRPNRANEMLTKWPGLPGNDDDRSGSSRSNSVANKGQTAIRRDSLGRRMPT